MGTAPVIHVPYARGPAGRRRLSIPRPWSVVLCAGMAVFGLGWWMNSMPSRELRSTAALLGEAYTGRRTQELRLPGAYAPLQPLTARQTAVPIGQRSDSGPAGGREPSGVVKGMENGSTFARPIALLEAESRIARHLAASPDDPDWLRLRARADLLDGDYEDAVSIARRAVDARPEDASLLFDLGTAYAMRAEGEGREIDYGAAIDTFWRVLRAHPDFPLAVFNRAVVYERMFLFDDARNDWNRYLELDGDGGWAAEARGRKHAIERRTEARDQAAESLASASGYLQAVQNGRAYDPEFYLDHAMREWLPQASTDANTRKALLTLAHLLNEKHQDPWMQDLLQARPDARYRDATAHLAASARHNFADEAEAALKEARLAEQGYRAGGVHAGELLAQYEQTYALFRAMQGSACLALAGKLARQAAHLHYLWIETESLMENGNCRTILGARGAGRGDYQEALSLSREAGYATVELRALGLLGANSTNLGNQLAVWHDITGRFVRYWQAPHRRNRGNQFYQDLSSSSASLGYPYSAFVFRRAAADELAGTPNLVLPAYAHALAAGFADAAGLPVEAKLEFDRARELFARCPPTPSVQLERFGVELREAEFETKSNPRKSLTDLQKLYPRDGGFLVKDTELSYFQTEGRAKLLLGDLVGAGDAFRHALQTSERELASLAPAADRYGPLHKSEDAYRGEVYVSLLRNPADALHQWEWYRSGDLGGPRRSLDSIASLPPPSGDIVLSYIQLPDGSFHVWVAGDGKLESRRLPVNLEQLEPVAKRFLRQCADPKSSLAILQRDARQLYDWLIAPVENRLQPGRTCVIEPDGPIGSLPLQALIDPAGNYLGERFPIVVSKGIAAYQERRQLPPLTSRDAALFVANPALGQDMARVFPPLEDAAREAQDIAGWFVNARLIGGSESTLERLEAARKNAQIFHFAGHSLSADGNAGLLLAPSQAGHSDGRLLTSATLLGQDWSRCSLVVLSACSTGTGERNGFVNPESLVRAFLNAGAGRVIASRWNVDNASTAGFMRHFYQSVLSGVLPSAALRQAAETLRKGPETAHPYYWAAFQLFGYK